ncbi:Neuroblast differentiation-associated protein AHNAK, partial [Eudyptes schlegeli]
ITKPDIEIQKGELSISSKETEEMAKTMMAAGEGPALGLKADIPGTKTEGAGWKVEKPSLKMPKADIKAPKVDISLPSVDVTLPKASVSLPKAEVSLPKAQAEVQEGEVALQGPDAEGGLEAAAGKVEGGGMKIHMPKVKVPSVVFSKPTVKAPKLDADVSLHKVDASLPEADLKAGAGTISVAAPDIKLPSFKMPKFDKPKFGVSPPKAEGLEGEVSLPTAEVDLPSATVTAAGEGPALGLKADIPGTKTEGAGWKVEKPSLKMPKADIKAPKVDISLPSVDVTLPKASVDLQAPEAALTLEGEAKAPEKEAAKTKDGKFKMPKFGMPSFGWSSSREAKGTVAADVDVSLKEPQVTVPSGTAEVDVTLPAAEIQAPGVEVTVETAAGGDGEKGRFKMPDVKMPSVKLPKVKAPHVQVSLPKAEVSLPKAQAEVQEGEVALQGPDAEGGLEAAAGKVEGGGMKIHMPKVKVPSVVFSKPTVKAPKLDADVSLHKVDASLPEADLKAGAGTISKGRFKMPDVKMPSVKLPKVKAPHVQVSLPKAEVSLPKAQAEVQEGEVALQGPDAEGGLEAAAGKVEGGGMKIHMPKVKVPSVVFSKPTVKAPKLDADVSLHKVDASLPEADLKAGAGTISVAAPDIKLPSFKMPKFDKPKFGVSPPKAEGLEGEVSLPTAEVDLPSATVTAAGEGPALGLKADIPGTKTEGAGWKVEKPSLKMPKADIKAPKVDISLPSVDVTLPKASVDLQAPEAALTLEGEAKAPEKEAAKTKDGKFKMPKFGMPSFGWSSSREAKGTPSCEIVLDAPNLDVSLPSMEVTMPKLEVEIHGPDLECKVDQEVVSGEKDTEEKENKFKTSKFKLPSFKVKAPKIDMDVSMPTGEFILPTCEEDDLTLKSAAADASLSTSFVKMVTEDSLEVKSPDTSVEKTSNEIAVGDIEIKIEGPEGKTKMSKFQMPKFGIIHSKGKGEGDDSIQTPDIERSHSERTEEGAQISIKLADVDIPTLEFSKIETGASQTEMGVSSAKIDAVLPPSEGSFQQVVLKSSSTDEDTIQKTGIKFPRGEASIELRSPEIVTERSSVVDGRKMKLEGPEGKAKMPKFQKPKFGISLTKGKVPETEISSPKIEAELPQLKMTNEIADIAVGVPASELTSDMSDPGVEGIPKLGDSMKSSDVSLSKIEGDTSLSTERTNSRVNIPKTETYADIVKHGAEGQKMHTSEFTVSSAELSKSYLSTSEIDKDNSLTNRFPAITVETVDKSQGGPEVNIKIPKLKIPRFTFKALPTEIDVSVSKVVTDPKGSSTDIEV